MSKKQLFFSSLFLALLDQIVLLFVRRFIPESIHWQTHIWFGSLPSILGLCIAAFLGIFLYLQCPAFFGWLFLLAGALSNVLSLLVYREIPDYIHLPFFYTNLADLLIILGCGVLAYEFLVSKKPR